jgi:CheY-like chemotaxis protein
VAQQLLAFSRRQVVQARVLALDGAVEEFRPTLERLLGATIQLEIRLAAPGARVRIDLGQLYQVLINLAANSRDAMPDGGRLVLVTGTSQLASGFATGHDTRELAPGPYASVVVSDTGAGMRPEIRRRAFEPFFTTKEVGSGTGLGLSIVYGIVQSAGGTVRLSSEPGKGTRAEVYLPLVAEEASSPASPSPGPEPAGERILLVEDDEVVRALARRALEDAGYKVEVAEDGEQALLLLDSDGGRCDLVVTDIVMPRLGGRALGRRVAERLPDLPVLYTSGYPGEETIGDDTPEEARRFLPKPFTPEELVRRVRAELDRVRGD